MVEIEATNGMMGVGVTVGGEAGCLIAEISVENFFMDPAILTLRVSPSCSCS